MTIFHKKVSFDLYLLPKYMMLKNRICLHLTQNRGLYDRPIRPPFVQIDEDPVRFSAPSRSPGRPFPACSEEIAYPAVLFYASYTCIYINYLYANRCI